MDRKTVCRTGLHMKVPMQAVSFSRWSLLHSNEIAVKSKGFCARTRIQLEGRLFRIARDEVHSCKGLVRKVVASPRSLQFDDIIDTSSGRLQRWFVRRLGIARCEFISSRMQHLKCVMRMQDDRLGWEEALEGELASPVSCHTDDNSAELAHY